MEWFIHRSDLIILCFDAHKLDISDEFRQTIESLKGHEDKVRVVLNKSDSVGEQELMRVYGALQWSLGKVLKSPEVVRVYVSSFWDKPYVNTEWEELFDKEKEGLLEVSSLCALLALHFLFTLITLSNFFKQICLFIFSFLFCSFFVIFSLKSKHIYIYHLILSHTESQ